MKKILFTYSTTENYKYVIKLLNNLERYGHIFRFIRLSKEIKFTNNKCIYAMKYPTKIISDIYMKKNKNLFNGIIM